MGYWIWVDSLNVTMFTDSWSAKVPATLLVFSDVPYSSQSEAYKTDPTPSMQLMHVPRAGNRMGNTSSVAFFRYIFRNNINVCLLLCAKED